MHELSIALSLIDAATEKAAELGAVRVEAVHLKLGALSGVVREALLFSFDLAAAGTPIEGARLEIEDIPVAVFCQTCNTEQKLPSIQCFRCPVCDTPTPDVVRGRELDLTALEVTDLDEAPEEETHATEDR